MVSKTLPTLIDRLSAAGITKINCGYRYYTLEVKKALVVENDACWGVTDFENGIIGLTPTKNYCLARETLLHELMHVALEMAGVSDEEATQKLPVMTNEELTTRVSRTLLMLINLNPELFAIINEPPPQKASEG